MSTSLNLSRKGPLFVVLLFGSISQLALDVGVL